MILTKEIKIKVNGKHKQYYTDLGYDTTQKEIIVKIEDLKKGSHSRVDVCCDICNTQNNILYSGYINNINNGDIYTCVQCSYIKNKKTKKILYGDENYNNPEKNKNTTLKLYGNENFRNNTKRKITCLEKYDQEHFSKTKKYKDSVKKTKLENHGNENYNNFEKIKETKLKVHGDKNYNNTEKYNKTCLERYGYSNFFQTDIFKKSQGIILDKDIKDKWILYKRQSARIIRKIKSKIFEKWNGYDFYDQEYIKDNINLSFMHGDYPTIDHRISVYYGFKNNIPVEEINKIENLVITKRCNNSSKGK